MLRAMGPFRATLTSQAAGNTVGWSQRSFTIGSAPLPVEPQQASYSPLHLNVQQDLMDSAYAAMLASEEALARTWDTPEEDAAWVDL
jgi:hypothetical protein